MKISHYGKDWLIIDEKNISQMKEEQKVHLIKLSFETPTDEKVDEVMDRFPSTKRFIISDNIRFYNYTLRTKRKYYVENKKNVNFISFLRKNNKILINYENLSSIERSFINENFRDLLKNVEVILVSDLSRLERQGLLKEIENWNGNVLIWR